MTESGWWMTENEGWSRSARLRRAAALLTVGSGYPRALGIG